MRYEFEILESETVYRGFFRLQRVRLRHSLFAGGWSPPLVREVLRKGHAVAVLLYDPRRDQVVMVEQFRIGALEGPAGPWMLELAAGYVEEGESLEGVAHREVAEETGCRVEALEPIASYHVSPGSDTEIIHLYCARVDAESAEGVHGLADEGEDIRVRVFSFDEAQARIADGTINSATPILALQWLALHRDTLRDRWR